MAQKAYVSFGYLFRMKYTDCLSFSSLNGRIAAAKHKPGSQHKVRSAAAGLTVKEATKVHV